MLMKYKSAVELASFIADAERTPPDKLSGSFRSLLNSAKRLLATRMRGDVLSVRGGEFYVTRTKHKTGTEIRVGPSVVQNSEGKYWVPETFAELNRPAKKPKNLNPPPKLPSYQEPFLREPTKAELVDWMIVFEMERHKAPGGAGGSVPGKWYGWAKSLYLRKYPKPGVFKVGKHVVKVVEIPGKGKFVHIGPLEDPKNPEFSQTYLKKYGASKHKKATRPWKRKIPLTWNYQSTTLNAYDYWIRHADLPPEEPKPAIPEKSVGTRRVDFTKKVPKRRKVHTT